MGNIGEFFIGIVAFIHLYIMWLEMFAWESSGKQKFKNALAEDLFKPTKVMAANQGLYNGFLAAGLIWTFFITDSLWKVNISFFFLSCVSVAGIYGAITIDKKIFFIQTAPAIIAIIILIETIYS